MLTTAKKSAKADHDIDAALELVLSLAYQNMTDRLDNPSEYLRQMRAYELVCETFNRTGE